MRLADYFSLATIFTCLVAGCSPGKSGSSPPPPSQTPVTAPDQKAEPDPLTPQGEGNVRRTERD